MIHDILLSLMNPCAKKIPIEDFLISEVSSEFIHPGEKKILEKIIEIYQKHREIALFTKEYGGNLVSPALNYDLEDNLPKGLYLQAFTAGIDKVLEDYFQEIADLEKRYLQNPSQSLLFVYQKVNAFQPLFHYLQRLIRGIQSQKLHGCAILQYIHQNMLHGNKKIAQAMKIIQSSVNLIFLKQLTHWILYGKIVDTYGEFFIQCSEFKNNTVSGSERCTSSGSGRHTATSISDGASTYAEIWRYEICYEYLPNYLTSSWAENVFFIGQIVLMFKVDANKSNKKAHVWNEQEKSAILGSLWNEKEHIFFKKIQDLQQETLNVSQYEKVVDEIKSYVTERLSQIAVDQADLIKQLKLVKDFYLLGRGELFLEFIKKTYSIGKGAVTENTIRDIVKAFDSAAHSVNISEDLEQFSINVPKESDLDEFENFGYLQNINLQYKINWPLHLLFSPKVIERYNELFRFLLLVKKMQYELHMVWCTHRKTKNEDVNVLLLRNQLMFLLDNLQYYIQVDVLESQFSILMNTVLNSSDFEQIQRAHSIFQANVMSLCFLLTKDEYVKSGVIQPHENPVYSILNTIFHLCEDFCNLLSTTGSPMGKSNIEKSKLLQKELLTLIEQVMSLLVGLKAAPCSTPLSQLLLRLDFNHWFSTQSGKKDEEQ